MGNQNSIHTANSQLIIITSLRRCYKQIMINNAQNSNL